MPERNVRSSPTEPHHASLAETYRILWEKYPGRQTGHDRCSCRLNSLGVPDAVRQPDHFVDCSRNSSEKSGCRHLTMCPIPCRQQRTAVDRLVEEQRCTDGDLSGKGDERGVLNGETSIGRRAEHEKRYALERKESYTFSAASPQPSAG